MPVGAAFGEHPNCARNAAKGAPATLSEAATSLSRGCLTPSAANQERPELREGAVW